MKINYLVALLVIFSVAVLGCAQTETDAMEKKDAMMEKEGSAVMEKNDAMMEKDVTVTLNALNNSGEQGTAVLSDMSGKTKVVVSVSGAPVDIPQPAHIHVGSCPAPGAVKYPLTSLMNGVSETVLDVSISKILGELPLAVNVHKSAADAKTYVSCGDISSEAMMKKSYTGKILAGTTTQYLDFNQADYEKALKENKKILLYFYANWCPICKKEQPETFAAFNELNDPDLIGFRVNFRDSDTDADEEQLAKEFGVSYQHTKVILKDGQRVLKAPDSWDRQRYLDEISKI